MARRPPVNRVTTIDRLTNGDGKTVVCRLLKSQSKALEEKGFQNSLFCDRQLVQSTQFHLVQDIDLSTSHVCTRGDRNQSLHSSERYQKWLETMVCLREVNEQLKCFTLELPGKTFKELMQILFKLLPICVQRALKKQMIANAEYTLVEQEQGLENGVSVSKKSLRCHSADKIGGSHYGIGDSQCIPDLQHSRQPCYEKMEFPKTVILTGSAGNGKTVLAHRLMKEWAQEFMPDKQTVFVVKAFQGRKSPTVIIVNGFKGENGDVLRSWIYKTASASSTSSCETVCIIGTYEMPDRIVSILGNIEGHLPFVKNTADLNGKHKAPIPTAPNGKWGVASEELKNKLLQADKFQRNAAHQAAIKGQLDDLKYFLETLGIPAESKSSNKLTMLHLAVLHEKEKVVEYLCESHTSLIHETDAIGRTAFHIAAQKNNFSMLRILIDHGTDVYLPAGDGATALHIVASHEKTEMVDYLCENFHFNYLNTANNLGMYPIHFAARCSIHNMEILFEKGEVPSVQMHTGATILHVAAHRGRLDILTYICEKHGRLLQMTDKVGFSPVHYAARHGQLVCLKYLLRFDNVSLVSEHGWTVVHMAARNGQLEVLRFLCKNYRTLAQKCDNDQWTAVHHAAITGHIHCLEYLCGNNIVDPYATERTGMTILHIAARYGTDETVQWLCRKFGDMVAMKDGQGQTALDHAHVNRIPKSIDALSKHL